MLARACLSGLGACLNGFSACLSGLGACSCLPEWFTYILEKETVARQGVDFFGRYNAAHKGDFFPRF